MPTPTRFDLIITADAASHSAEFRLCDAAGVQLAYHRTDFKTLPVSQQRGLFDLRNHLRHYVEAGKEQAAVAAVGVCIAEKLLGESIFVQLWRPHTQRTLCIQLPGAGNTENHLAAALARVPWEIARPAADRPSLGERNLLVRVVHAMQAPASAPIELAAGEALRVLFVFAESRGSRPLGARKERRELLQLFEQEIYPQRRIVAHFLTHGVTRERLAAQIQEHGGYHIVHWSGHGHMNLLELCKPGGASDHLSGAELLEIFTQAGGLLPRLFFLSACHSGDILRVKDWNDFFAVAQGQEPGTREADAKDLDLKDPPGYTGTAHALLQGGVPSVVAMRYAVGDDYAREVALAFYRALLAHAQPKSVAAALTMARQALRDVSQHPPAQFSACDHATPVLYGEEQPGLNPANGRSLALNPRNPRLHQIAELTTAEHVHFVGRTWELVGLGAEFISASTSAKVKPVAVITGLGGMGKTALTAEALALWETRFEWVLLYQAKPNALGLDATLRDIHQKLMGELKRYHDHVRAHPADAIHREASAEFTGPARLERLTRNLLRAMQDEPILLVLDNFETNLKAPDPATGLAACQDPAWDACLALLAQALAGSRSRVLITSRHRLAVLAAPAGELAGLATGEAAHVVPLGPLPRAEAALYLKEQLTLSRMVFGTDGTEQALACRLLTASRFHPLLMDRLAKLAAHPALRPQLLAALDALENTQDFAQLPALFASTPGDVKELAYLNDALATSLDLLIRNVSPDARRLLWIIALANQPEVLGLVRGVWSGETHEQQQQRQIKQMLDRLPMLPPEMQAKLKEMPLELRARLAALPPEPPDVAPLLAQLVRVGLVTEERSEPSDANPNLACHELVRERIRAWMVQQPQDGAQLSENAIRLAYAERLEATFKARQHQNMSAALEAGSRALVYCVQAGAWDRLSRFASSLVTSTSDQHSLEALLPHLQTAAESAPEGRLRRFCLTSLADALCSAGRPNASLPFYEQAATQARAVAEMGDEDSRNSWSDLAAIYGNWAVALAMTGDIDTAYQCRLDSAEAFKNAGQPAIYAISSTLEALRIKIMQDPVAVALPEVEARLAQVEAWWQQHQSGQPAPEAPDAEFLARTLISTLDIARQVHFAQNDWPSALRRIRTILEVQCALGRSAEDISATRMNLATVLIRLRRFSKARADLEACLTLFQNDPARSSKIIISLADLFNEQGDTAQAITQQRRALALCEALPDPADRAISHNNLANYLERGGGPAEQAESSRHRLAALVYFLVVGLGQNLQTLLQNYAIDFRHAHAAGTELVVPRLADLLAEPAFAPLAQWLRERGVPLDKLQAEVDQLLTQARQNGTAP